MLAIVMFASFTQQESPKKVFIQSIDNKIAIGDLSGNRNLTFGVKNILLENLQEMNYDVTDSIKDADYVIKVELLYFDIIQTSSGVSVFHKDENETILRVKGYLYDKNGKIFICMAVVYRHLREDTNEVFYIGIGKTDKRAYEKNQHRSDFWKNIAKNGFKVDIIFDDLTWEEAGEKEKEFILLYGRKDKGLGCLVNMTDGGDGGYGIIVKEETKEKIRLFQLSLNKKGKPGRKQSSEIREKIKNTLTGRKRPDDVIQKMRKPKPNKENYAKPKQKIECPHCQMLSQPALAYRWHFDNCKHKKI